MMHYFVAMETYLNSDFEMVSDINAEFYLRQIIQLNYYFKMLIK